MRYFSALVWLACAILALTPASAVRAQSAGSDGSRSNWYLAVAAGSAGGDSIGQEGWNRDDLCYPDMACFSQEPPVAISGYRWRYDIGREESALFELAAGRYVGRARVELAVGRQRNDADQKFTALSYYDGSALPPPPDTPVEANSQAWIDSVNTRYISLDAYYDFPNAWGGLSPFVGAGLGRAWVEIAGLHYSSEYRDTGPAAKVFEPRLSFYNSSQNADLRDDVLLWRLHAGADYHLSSDTLLGLKLTWSGARSFEVTESYDVHAQHQRDPGFSNTTAFSGIRNWSASLSLKRLFGH